MARVTWPSFGITTSGTRRLLATFAASAYVSLFAFQFFSALKGKNIALREERNKSLVDRTEVKGVDTQVLSGDSYPGTIGRENGIPIMYRKAERGDVNAANLPGFPEFLIDASWLCSKDPEDSTVQDAFLLVLVHSRPDTPAQRHAIRDTWGRLSRKFHGDRQTRLLFLLGDISASPSVIRESRLYRDIALVRLQDTYRNLTLKALAGLHWIQKFCNQVSFVLKTDDDVYFHLPHLLQFLDTSSFSGRTPVILGSLNRNSSVLRYGLWEVDERDFPGERYPPYCSGNSYLLSTPAVLSLVSAARHVPTLPLEDVYLTGVLPPTAGLQCRHHPAFPHWITGDTQDNLCQLRSGWLFGIHNVHYNRMYRIQRFLDRGSNQSGSARQC